MVEAVELGQPFRAGLLVLQFVDQADLPADQVLGAPADVAEHLRDVAPAEHLPLDELRRGALDPFEDAGQVADLVLRVQVEDLEADRFDRFTLVVGDPPQLRLTGLGDPFGRPAELGQGHRDGPGHDRDQHQDGEQNHQDKGTDDVRDGQLSLSLLRDRRGHLVGQSLLDEAAENAERPEGGEQFGDRQRRHRPGRVGVELLVELLAEPVLEGGRDQVVKRPLVAGGKFFEAIEVRVVLRPLLVVAHEVGLHVAARHRGQQRGALGVGLVEA